MVFPLRAHQLLEASAAAGAPSPLQLTGRRLLWWEGVVVERMGLVLMSCRMACRT
jgi:hypothetical protein